MMKKLGPNFMDKKKLLKQTGEYNLVQLKTHLQDEGQLDPITMEEMIVNFTKIVRNFAFI